MGPSKFKPIVFISLTAGMISRISSSPNKPFTIQIILSRKPVNIACFFRMILSILQMIDHL